MCVAQINSYQDEVLAMIRKAQSRGLQVLNIEYDQEILETEGTWIIDVVTVVGARGPFNLSCLGAREWVGEWLWKEEQRKAEAAARSASYRRKSFCA